MVVIIGPHIASISGGRCALQHRFALRGPHKEVGMFYITTVVQPIDGASYLPEMIREDINYKELESQNKHYNNEVKEY
jgi:hypothetical protein